MSDAGRSGSQIWNEALETAANLIDPVDAPEEQEREAGDVARAVRARKIFPPASCFNAQAVDPVEVWWSIENDGAGAAGIGFFLTRKRAEASQEEHNTGDHPWGEGCTGRLETYVGSNAYASAVRNETAAIGEGEFW